MPKVVIDRRPGEKIGEIVGAFCGDGTYYIDKNYKHSIAISLAKNEKWYANYLNNCFYNVFHKKGWIWLDTKKNLILLRIFGVDIIKFIHEFAVWKDVKTYSIKLKKSISNYDKKFLIGFLRGLYMTDGWLNKGKSTANFGCTSQELVDNFSKCLSKFEIAHHRYSFEKEGRKELFYLTIPKEECYKFFNLIKIKKMLPRGISGKTF